MTVQCRGRVGLGTSGNEIPYQSQTIDTTSWDPTSAGKPTNPRWNVDLNIMFNCHTQSGRAISKMVW